MIPKTTITIEPFPDADAQVLTTTFYLPSDEHTREGENPRVERLLDGLDDHLRHYNLILAKLDNDGRAVEHGDTVRVTLTIAGAYAAPVVLRVADEILKVALLFTD